VLPGKTYTPEEALRILRRYKWLLLVPFAVGLAGAIFLTRRLPDRYRSETLIMLVPQRVPDSYVRSTVTAKIEDRLPTISQQILSRSRLERVITDLNLYTVERQHLLMEDVISRMRRDIDVRLEKGDSFRVSYVSADAKLAKLVTERLASLFIEENLRDRENQAEDTNQFLDSQLEDARRRLVEHEKKLEEYRKRFNGELPSQTASNLQFIQNTQSQLQALLDATDRERERRLILERQLADLQSPNLIAVPVAPVAANPDAVVLQSSAQQLESAQARLQELLRRVKPDHPDVRIAQRQIRELETKLRAEQSARSAADALAPVPEKPIDPAEAIRERRMRDLQAQIDDIDRGLGARQAQEEKLRAEVVDYQARLAAAPSRESELVELTRDYGTLQATYASLLAKREDSKMAANLERRNIGEQFKILDAAQVPERPFSPNRPQLLAMGAGGGLAFGLAIVALLEYRDGTFKNDEEVLRVIKLPVLAIVPEMGHTRRWPWTIWPFRA
jgi:protein tyrosine kinase modulator